MSLVLFDIDGTLILTHGAGMRALARAARERQVLERALESMSPDGKTDPLIIRELMEVCGRAEECTPQMVSGFLRSYVTFLKEEMAACASLQVLPGVRGLLSTLAQDSFFKIGLATGNIEEGAWIKLRHAGLDSYFSFGGFASDAEERTELIRIAIRRGRALAPANQGQAAFVIGDTPRDIIHGREAGAHTIAVATGAYSLEQLEECHPDLAVPTLESVQPILSLLKHGSVR
jgi:phosphoglycolate phosphatase